MFRFLCMKPSNSIEFDANHITLNFPHFLCSVAPNSRPQSHRRMFHNYLLNLVRSACQLQHPQRHNSYRRSVPLSLLAQLPNWNHSQGLKIILLLSTGAEFSLFSLTNTQSPHDLGSRSPSFPHWKNGELIAFQALHFTPTPQSPSRCSWSATPRVNGLRQFRLSRHSLALTTNEPICRRTNKPRLDIRCRRWIRQYQVRLLTGLSEKPEQTLQRGSEAC